MLLAEFGHLLILVRGGVIPGLGLDVGGDELFGVVQQHAAEAVAETFDTAERSHADGHGEDDEEKFGRRSAEFAHGHFEGGAKEHLHRQPASARVRR